MADRRWRLLRGCSWLSHPRFCRSAYRNYDRPDFALDIVGFRVVCPDPGDHTIALEDPHG